MRVTPILALAFTVACGGEPHESAAGGDAAPAPASLDSGRPEANMDAPATITLTSPAFPQGGNMPADHTCDGRNSSPPLAWSDLPEGTRSLALIVDDPDAPDPRAPKRTWVHWVLYDVPPTVTELAAGASPKGLPAGAREGVNDFGRTGYGGPCPPVGRHRYFHKLYALDTVLTGLSRPDKARLEQAMAGHVLGQGELVGTYRRGE